jgi:hypothetical protein
MPRAYSQEDQDRKDVRHVLLISIDGMHALDYENCVKAATCPNLAALGTTAVNYTRTSTSKTSDSFWGFRGKVNAVPG